MEGNDPRPVLGLGALLAMAMLLFRGGAGSTWSTLGPGKPERPQPIPRPRIRLPEGSVKRHG
jgi:hypothetical protein